MSTEKRGKEPKVHWHFLFRLIAGKAVSEELEARRFAGLANREGVLPFGNPTDDSVIEYYTEKDQRNKSTVRLLDMETKSALDDPWMKFSGTLLFIAFVVLSIASGWFDEIRTQWLPAREGEDYTVPAILLFVAGVLVANAGLFFWKYNLFHSMDLNWTNALEKLFARNARAQMDAVLGCMVVFKRFLKWRRYMRLMMNFALPIMGAQLVLAITGLPPGLAPSWSSGEMWFSRLFVVGEAIWFLSYFYMWAFYTTYRDPTLQLCTLVNVMDRATVLTPTIAERR
jgi:hypothetical protein